MDNKDKKLLNILQDNGRESLTNLAKALNLSIDSTHKRMKKLVNNGIAHHRTLVDPKKIGYDLVANVQIKLHNIGELELKKFISHLKSHPRIVELISIIGDYDLTCVIIAKNSEDLEEVSRKIRHEFKELIADWKVVINLKVYKFEEYDMMGL